MYARVFSIATAIPLSPVFVSQAASNESLSGAATHWGNASVGGGAGNRIFGYQSSYRFRAPCSGAITSVLFHKPYQTYSQMREDCDKGSQPDSDCGKNGLDEYTCGYVLSNPWQVSRFESSGAAGGAARRPGDSK